MNWFIVESTTGSAAAPHRYSINAECMKIDGQLIAFYGTHQEDRFPIRVLKLEPGQIVFKASKEQAALIDQCAKVQTAEPKGVVQ